MGPRKRTRQKSQPTSPTSSSHPKTPIDDQCQSQTHAEEQLLNNPWTDEEELGLFKGLIRWKPTGIHKHFHLLALHHYLVNEGYIHPHSEHTKPAGVWKKLQTLYDLDALDSREDARQLSDLSLEDHEDEDEDGEVDIYSEAQNKIQQEDFVLPDEDFSEMMWQQRIVPEPQRRNESPPILPEINLAERPPIRFTPSFSVEPSEIDRSSRKPGRSRIGTVRNKGRNAVFPTSGAPRRSARKAESAADEEEQAEEVDQQDHGELDNEGGKEESGQDDDEEEEEEEEDEEENDDEDEEQKSEEVDEDEEREQKSTHVRSTRTSRSGVRARPMTRTRGRGRKGK